MKGRAAQTVFLSLIIGLIYLRPLDDGLAGVQGRCVCLWRRAAQFVGGLTAAAAAQSTPTPTHITPHTTKKIKQQTAKARSSSSPCSRCLAPASARSPFLEPRNRCSAASTALACTPCPPTSPRAGVGGGGVFVLLLLFLCVLFWIAPATQVSHAHTHHHH